MAISLYKINMDNVNFIMENYPEETDLINAIDFFTKAAQQNDYDIEEFNKAFETMEKTLDSKEFKDLAEQIQNDPECNKTEAFNRAQVLGTTALVDSRVALLEFIKENQYSQDPDEITRMINQEYQNHTQVQSRLAQEKTSMEMAADYIKQALHETVQKIADSINHARQTVEQTTKNAVDAIKQGGKDMTVAAKQMCLNTVKNVAKAAGDLEHKMNSGIKQATVIAKNVTKEVGDAVKEAPTNAQKARLHLLNGMDKCVIAAQTYVKDENTKTYYAGKRFTESVVGIANTVTKFSESIRQGMHHASEAFNEKIINHRYRTDESNWRFYDSILDKMKGGMTLDNAKLETIAEFEQEKDSALSELHKAENEPGPSKLAKAISGHLQDRMVEFYDKHVAPYGIDARAAENDIKNREANIDARNEVIEDIEQGK